MTRRLSAGPVGLKGLLRENGAASAEYHTRLGVCLVGESEKVLQLPSLRKLRGKVQLIFTSPPFPLNRKKKYGNREGDEFKRWLSSYAPLLREMLTETGSIVMEMGNSWEPGRPVMSTLAMESLLEFKRAGDLNLCQEFIWHNPAKLPTPAQWVAIDRVRVKDSFTRLWWLSPTENPKADNRRVLVPYSGAMEKLLKTQRYNAGPRPSEHVITPHSFLRNNGGAIPPSVLEVMFDPGTGLSRPGDVLTGSNTSSSGKYESYCKEIGVVPHPARMPPALAQFFIRLCTDEKDIVLDPFSGSNTTGAAAEELDRRWVSIEASADYAKAGSGRFPPTAVNRLRHAARLT